MESIWSNTVQLPRFPPQRGDIKTDILIIGGGITGILCAHMLQQAGVECVVAEAGRICGGVTRDTTAKITSQHGLIYDGLIRRFGSHRAGLYLQANQQALAQYRDLCRDIDCGFEDKDAYVYTLTDPRKIDRDAEALHSLGFPAQPVVSLPLPLTVAGALRFPRQAQFHPLRFVAALVPGLRIFEHTPIQELRPGGVLTTGGRIDAEKIIVATHFPFLNKHGSYFLKLYQHRSYVLALKNAPDPGGMYVDEAETGLSFRSAGELLLLGGGGHRTGKRGGAWRELADFARQHYPGSAEVCRWAAQDCMTLDNLPYIGRYSRRTPRLYVATGYNKWGMTSAMAAAMLLRDLILERNSPWEELFSPSRSILRPQLAINALESALHLLTPTVPRCPHMGCALKYNALEHSWDCPCHGSRFTETGGLLDGPATGDLERPARP